MFPRIQWLLLSLVTLGGAVAASGQARRTAGSPLEPLRFLAGCWRGPSGAGPVIEEHYTGPSDNLILGMTRYLRGDSATGYEFSTIAWHDSTIVLTPRPEGQRPVPFRLTFLGPRHAVWENPRHDFPTRIAYRRLPGDTLVARIEGPGPNGPRSSEWRMTPARCDG